MLERQQILFVSIATNRYWDFIADLHASVRKYWSATEVEPRFLVFTNRPDARPAAADTQVLPIEHRPWPAMSIYRYHLFLTQQQVLAQSRWVTYLDADLRVVADLGRQLLCRSYTVLHPAYAHCQDPARLPFERRPESTAYVPLDHPGAYFHGGIQGGESADFLAVCEALQPRIDQDHGRGLSAVWWDESHLNYYRSHYPAERTLGPEFAYPDVPAQARAWGVQQVKPVVLALTRDHVAFRYPPLLRSVFKLQAGVGKIWRRVMRG